MREILFRGRRNSKRADGQWVTGLLIHYCDKSACIYSDALDRAVWVDPETVGQFTGLSDKNGKKIFEGDIVCWPGTRNMGVVQYGEFNCSCCDGVYGWHFGDADIRDYDSYEVIGNIYDTPALMPDGD